MANRTEAASRTLDVSILIEAPPPLVLNAFFDPVALAAWWQIVRSVTIPRALGPYTLEWRPTDFRDEIRAVVRQVNIAGTEDTDRIRSVAQKTVDEMLSLMKPPSAD